MDLLADAQPQWLLAGAALLLATIAFLKVLLGSGGSGKRVPPLIPGAPVVGGLLRFLRGPILLIRAEYARLGPVFTVPILTRQITFLIGPDVSAHFFKSNESDMSQQDWRSDSPSDKAMLLPPINCLDIDFAAEAQDRPIARLPE